MSSKVSASVLGATGYTGIELVRLLAGHPYVRLSHLVSHSHAGQTLGAVYPHLGFSGSPGNRILLSPEQLEEVLEDSDVLFLALPHGVAPEYVPRAMEHCLVIDLGADYRLKELSAYEEWYGAPHPQPDLVARAVYGLPELHRGEIASAGIVANPGCYPTSVILGLYPLLREELLVPETIVVDAKSGVSGAGRTLDLGLHYCEVNDSLRAYRPAGTHRHTAEMEQELSLVAGREVRISFTPHLVPMTRGILSTIYGSLQGVTEASRLRELFLEYYSEEPFIEVLPEGMLPRTKSVYGSNYCQLGIHVDSRTNRVVVVSCIDNLVKGAAGQAIQNMNLAVGFEEGAGLGARGLVP